MKDIILKKQKPEGKQRRAAVVVKPETYKKIYDLSFETNTPIETIVDTLLCEALKFVKIED